jgi:hypothetical protein
LNVGNVSQIHGHGVSGEGDTQIALTMHFGIANRAGAGSYFFMNRLVSVTSLAIATLLVLTGCATDDDPFPVHPAATTADSEVPVAGAASPAGESSSAGWKW